MPWQASYLKLYSYFFSLSERSQYFTLRPAIISIQIYLLSV
jgi:hypothetical protein